MARIPVEKQTGTGWWKWLLALLLLAVLVWLLVELFDTDEPEIVEEEAVGVVEEPAATTPEPMAGATGVTFGEILANSNEYIGDPFPRTEVSVAEVPTDRGFWIEEDGQRLFAVIIDVPQEEPKDINPGQTLSIEDGTLRAPSYLGQLAGRPLDQDTQNIAEQQEIFLVVDERYIDILEGGTPQ